MQKYFVLGRNHNRSRALTDIAKIICQHSAKLREIRKKIFAKPWCKTICTAQQLFTNQRTKSLSKIKPSHVEIQLKREKTTFWNDITKCHRAHNMPLSASTNNSSKVEDICTTTHRPNSVCMTMSWHEHGNNNNRMLPTSTALLVGRETLTCRWNNLRIDILPLTCLSTNQYIHSYNNRDRVTVFGTFCYKQASAFQMERGGGAHRIFVKEYSIFEF